MVDPVLPPLVTLPCTMCNDELVDKPEPPPKVFVLILILVLALILSQDSFVLSLILTSTWGSSLFLDIVLGSSVENIFYFARRRLPRPHCPPTPRCRCPPYRHRTSLFCQAEACRMCVDCKTCTAMMAPGNKVNFLLYVQTYSYMRVYHSRIPSSCLTKILSPSRGFSSCLTR